MKGSDMKMIMSSLIHLHYTHVLIPPPPPHIHTHPQQRSYIIKYGLGRHLATAQNLSEAKCKQQVRRAGDRASGLTKARYFQTEPNTVSELFMFALESSPQKKQTKQTPLWTTTFQI